MGGNALSIPSRRIGREEYFPLLDRVLCNLLNPPLQVARARDIPAYRQKADFGDLDMLVVWSQSYPPHRETIRTAFGLAPDAEIIQNDNVFSFGIDGFQVDLIGCSAEPGRFEAALNYFSWNDLGNLMGRIAHKLGFKYGHQGLLLPVRDRHGHIVEEITVSLQTVPILEFLGYDPQPFFAGFDTLEEMFTYAASSTFFDPAIFQLENLNHINRLRNRKRDSYMKFVEWVAAHPKLPMLKLVGVVDTPDVEEAFRDVFFSRTALYFDQEELQAKLDAAHARIARKEEISRRFNGTMVREMFPDLAGQRLGRAITAFKQLKGRWTLPFDDWALARSEKEIREEFRAFMRAWPDDAFLASADRP